MGDLYALTNHPVGTSEMSGDFAHELLQREITAAGPNPSVASIAAASSRPGALRVTPYIVFGFQYFDEANHVPVTCLFNMRAPSSGAGEIKP